MAKIQTDAQPTPKAGLHPQKRILSIWWCVKGVIYNVHQLNKLESEVLSSSKIYFQHDNAKLHITKFVKKEQSSLTGNCYPIHHIALSYYHLFRSLSNQLREKIFENELRRLFDSKSEELYAKGIHSVNQKNHRLQHFSQRKEIVILIKINFLLKLLPEILFCFEKKNFKTFLIF